MLFFFFNDTATTEIYTFPLHGALRIWQNTRRTTVSMVALAVLAVPAVGYRFVGHEAEPPATPGPDRKSTRLNSSHANIPYAVFCLENNHLLGNKAHSALLPTSLQAQCV